MKVINFYNVKGGVGKSSLAYLTGLFLASKGSRILFVDLDPQASLSHRLLTEKPKRTLFNYLAESESIIECITEINPRISLISSELKLNKVLSGIPENAIKKILKSFSFDYVILDNPPSWNSLVISGIASSDKVFIPTLLSQNDMDSAKFTLSEIKDLKEEIETCIILNRVSKKESKEEIDYLKSYQFDSMLVRFHNLTGLKRVIDRGESLESKRNQVLRDSIESIFNLSGLIV